LRANWISVVALALSAAFTAPAANPPAKAKSSAKKTAPKKSAARKTAGKITASGKKAASSKQSTKKQTAQRPPAKKTARRATAQREPTADRYKEIQQALADKGYFGGPVDGNWGPDSVDALKHFQRDQNIGDDGKIGSLSLIALGLGPRRDGQDAHAGQQEP
jgi:Putative peptidoglycan binding domain